MWVSSLTAEITLTVAAEREIENNIDSCVLVVRVVSSCCVVPHEKNLKNRCIFAIVRWRTGLPQVVDRTLINFSGDEK